MSKRVATKSLKARKNFNQKLMAIPLIILVIKFIVLTNIQNHAWIGADGENYIGALQGLLKDGYFSNEHLLSYWPAGYPLLMYLFGSISRTNTLMIMAIFQSILYAVSSLLFVRELAKTKLSKYCFWIAWILSLNPTLSLSSMVIGYEIIPASIFLLAITLFIREYNTQNANLFSKNSIAAACFMSLSCFVQPRFLLTAAILFLIWAFRLKPKRIIPLFLVVTMVLTSLLPISLALRNSKANGYTAISTNLGITMNLGAGPGASGKYEAKGKYGVPCAEVKGNAAQQDSHLTKCVITWYLKNPIEALPLIMRKAAYFWSPWFGPEVAGSMNRNPWFQNHPFKSIASNSVEGANLVYGTVGKTISWLWMLAGLAFIYLGFRRMWNVNGIVRQVGLITLIIVITNWAVSVGTLGDHRQRLPIMTASLFLQCVGIVGLFGKKWRIATDGPANKQ